MICATIQSATALTSQLTMMFIILDLQPEIMISHGDALRRNLRLRISGLETRLLPGQASGRAISEALRRTAKLRGDQLHVPPSALGQDARKLGGGHSAGLRVRGEGEHADHPYSAPEKRRGGHRVVPEDDRPAAHRAPPGPDSLSVAAGGEVRPGSAAKLPGPAARRHALRLRVPPQELAGG